jgi:hypothetical protein
MLGCTGCNSASDESATKVGKALLTTRGTAGFGTHLAPAQEMLNIVTAFTNRSDRPVVLTRVVPRVSERYREAATLVGVRLSDPSFGGTFHTNPPVEQRGRSCAVGQLHPVKGYRVKPQETTAIALWIGARREGRFKIDYVDIFYRQGGDLYWQRDRYSLVVKVRKGWRRTLPGEEQRCAHHATLLNGNEVT